MRHLFALQAYFLQQSLYISIRTVIAQKDNPVDCLPCFWSKTATRFCPTNIGCTKIEYVLINSMNENTTDILNENISK